MTKKRMIKLIMGMGYPRNVANEVAFYIVVQGLQYKDFREILEEIRGKADVICSRYASMVEDMEEYNEIARRIVPTEANPYPLASLNFHFDFDLCNQYRLTRVLKMHYRRKARRAVRRLSATMRKASMAASEAATAFSEFGNACAIFTSPKVAGYMGALNPWERSPCAGWPHNPFYTAIESQPPIKEAPG